MSNFDNGAHISFLRPNREPDFVIGPKVDPYMLRWWLVPRNDVFNIYYHMILHDDDDRALHDHPWPSFSILLKGSLREITPNGPIIYNQGACVYREAEHSHRLELIDGVPAETLFITGPKVREWGFHCPNGWRHFKDFVGGDGGEVGRGCGEMDSLCPRCGTTLKQVEVKRPVYKTAHSAGGGYVSTQEVSHYVTQYEQADCVRCTGSY